MVKILKFSFIINVQSEEKGKREHCLRLYWWILLIFKRVGVSVFFHQFRIFVLANLGPWVCMMLIIFWFIQANGHNCTIFFDRVAPFLHLLGITTNQCGNTPIILWTMVNVCVISLYMATWVFFSVLEIIVSISILPLNIFTTSSVCLVGTLPALNRNNFVTSFCMWLVYLDAFLT